jgi:hypothetical protein
MAVVNVVIASYRGLHQEANAPLGGMTQAVNCLCRDRHGTLLHNPWECTNGKHSVRVTPPIYASSVVHWARNQAVAQSLYGQPDDGRPPADYLFLMDDDMVGLPNYLGRLLSYKLDIVCGICTIRRDPPRPNIRFWREDLRRFVDPVEWDWDSQKLMEVDAAGAAFMLVKRKVFERMGEAHLNCEFELAEDARKFGTDAVPEQIKAYWAKKSAHRKQVFEEAAEHKIWGQQDCWWFSFEKNIIDDQIGELGEDIGFCWKAKQLGFKIFADPQVLPGHLGFYSYSIRDWRVHIEQSKEEGVIPTILPPNVAALTPREIRGESACVSESYTDGRPAVDSQKDSNHHDKLGVYVQSVNG